MNVHLFVHVEAMRPLWVEGWLQSSCDAMRSGGVDDGIGSGTVDHHRDPHLRCPLLRSRHPRQQPCGEAERDAVILERVGGVNQTFRRQVTDRFIGKSAVPIEGEHLHDPAQAGGEWTQQRYRREEQGGLHHHGFGRIFRSGRRERRGSEDQPGGGESCLQLDAIGGMKRSQAPETVSPDEVWNRGLVAIDGTP